MTSGYSTVQKLSLAGTVVGALMCVVGACAPYWLITDPQGFSGIGQLVGKVVKGYMGLFVYCVQVKLLDEKECHLFDMDNDSGWFHVARVNAAACVLLAILAGLISLCLACCTCCKRIIAVGILAFLAAACGAATAIIFDKNMDVFTTSILDYKLASFGWAFYLFCAGVGILGVVSFMACFSAPENPIRGMILSQPASIIVNSGRQPPYYNLQEQGQVDATADPGVTVVTSSGY